MTTLGGGAFMPCVVTPPPDLAWGSVAARTLGARGWSAGRAGCSPLPWVVWLRPGRARGDSHPGRALWWVAWAHPAGCGRRCAPSVFDRQERRAEERGGWAGTAAWAGRCLGRGSFSSEIPQPPTATIGRPISSDGRGLGRAAPGSAPVTADKGNTVTSQQMRLRIGGNGALTLATSPNTLTSIPGIQETECPVEAPQIGGDASFRGHHAQFEAQKCHSIPPPQGTFLSEWE